MNIKKTANKGANPPFQVSVIVPIFNGKQYIEKAVQSALIQLEVVEVILIDDGSTDGSLKLAQQIASQKEKVKSLHHPGNKNVGLGATRNLGIKHAVAPYVAMLDVDDYFYPDRFKVTKEVFAEYPDADVVYEMIENVFTSEEEKSKWLQEGKSLLLGITKKVPPHKVFDTIVENNSGDIGQDGLTIKRSIFEKSGYYPTVTKTVGEDTNLLLRIASVGNIYAGSFEPVAARLIHGENASLEADVSQIDKQIVNYEEVLTWFQHNKVDIKKGKKLMLRVLIHNSFKFLNFIKLQKRQKFWQKINRLKKEFPEFWSFQASILSIVLVLGLFSILKKIILVFAK